jgi:DNA polymerase-3 subunit alpha
MLRLRRVVSWNWFEENYTKEQLDVPAGYFQEFQNKNQEIALIGLKHINLKGFWCHSSAVWKKQTATVSKAKLSENKSTGWYRLCIYITTQFSVLQSTISIPQLVKAASKEKMPAVAMTDHAELDGGFSLCSWYLIIRRLKPKCSINRKRWRTRRFLKPIVGCEFYEDHKDKTRGTTDTK